MGILEKISEIEKEIARTQKNKGTFWMIFGRMERQMGLHKFQSEVINSITIGIHLSLLIA